MAETKRVFARKSRAEPRTRGAPRSSERDSKAGSALGKVVVGLAGGAVALSAVAGLASSLISTSAPAPPPPVVQQVSLARGGAPSFESIPQAPQAVSQVPASAPAAGQPSVGVQSPNLSAGSESASSANALPQPASGAESASSASAGNALSHNPSPAEMQGPELGQEPSAGLQTNPNPNPNTNANPNPNAGTNPAPTQGREPAPQTQSSEPPAQSSSPPSNNGPPSGIGNSDYGDTVLVAPYTPCGQPFSPQRTEARMALAKRGELPAPTYHTMRVFYPPTGEYKTISSEADLAVLRDSNLEGWMSFMASYGQLENSRYIYPLSLSEGLGGEFVFGFWYSDIALKLFWADLNEYSFKARMAETLEQQAIAPPSRFVISILNNHDLPVISFEESYRRIHGGKYPASASYITSLTIRQLIDEGYIWLVNDWHTLEFTGNASYGIPNGFGLVMPNVIGAKFNYLAWRYANPSTGKPPMAVGFDFPPVAPIKGMTGPNLMVMAIDEPDVFANHIMGSETGPLLPLQWRVGFEGRDSLEVEFDVSAVVDWSINPAPQVVR